MHTHVRTYVDPLYNLPLVLQRLTALTSGHKKTTSLLFRWATGRLVQVALRLQIWLGCGYENSLPPGKPSPRRLLRIRETPDICYSETSLIRHSMGPENNVGLEGCWIMECLLPYLCMVTVPHIMVGLERMLD